MMQKGNRVRHPSLGLGTVMMSDGTSVVVRFEHGIEECEPENLQPVSSLFESLSQDEWNVPLQVVSRGLALAIRSTNDAWGVFSRSRMELLPHQLWVCHKVNQVWPTRWLVADDVGLGKTIEAGMIVWPLLSRGTVRRLLILCPASLVEQWTYRLRTMFDIRLTTYTTEADTPRSDFWGTHNQVVASMQTLRMESRERQERLLESDPWDLVLVDEAHHLGADEHEGFTLGYKLIKRLTDEYRIRSMVFFTGTPHRGKNHAFFALLQLLRPDLFDPRGPLAPQLKLLPEVMIRNNKSRVTDIKGNSLFTPVEVVSETYAYSASEDRFYRLMTQFILDGQAYASSLSQKDGQVVILVLIAMQKLASSSVAAIRRAIQGRLSRLNAHQGRVSAAREALDHHRRAESSGSLDELNRAEEELPILDAALKLMDHEETALRALLAAADEVQYETKIQKILELLEKRFPDRSVLFFTEYKATQSLLMSALVARYGKDCVVFINGDDRAEDVRLPDGKVTRITLPREEAALRFNGGQSRFLVATEAGGEGIDLQENCHTLIHVDLPWNPMRLHQRVGRLNRYGQKNPVEVVTIRNPDTVESLIWDKLNEKLEKISLALGQVMDEPEDLLQMVLGMTSPTFFRDLFAGAPRETRESVGQWFDQETASFGNQDIVQAVIDLVGNAASFDFQEVSPRIPRVDLPDLRPFLEGALKLNDRRPKDEDGCLSFLTPEAWQVEPAVRREYRGMRFDRSDRSPEAAKRLLGVGHAAMDQALRQAKERTVNLATVPFDILQEPVILFTVRDRVTEHRETSRTLLVGVEVKKGGHELLLDWQVLQRLNQISWRKLFMSQPSPAYRGTQEVLAAVEAAGSFLNGQLGELGERFRVPELEIQLLLWPRKVELGDTTESEI